MPSSSQVDVVGVGLNATDTLIPVHQFPAAGSKIEFRSANVLPGGHATAAATTAATWARQAAIPVVADLDDLYPGVDALLPLVDYLITSRDIPGRISGDSDLRQSLPAVRAKYNARLTAATLGP